MAERTLMITIVSTGADDIARSESGTPSIEVRAAKSWLYLATPTADGWLLETWHEDDPIPARQQLNLLPDLDNVTAEVTRAIHAAAAIRGEDETP